MRLVLAVVLTLSASATIAAQIPPPAQPPSPVPPAAPTEPAPPPPVSPSPDAATPPPPAPQAAADENDEDMRLDPAQPDFTLINLPTTLRLPRFKSAFRVTHRFTRPLGQGDVGDLLDDFFGFDSAALIGLEFRMGLAPGFQVGIHRTSGSKNIQFFSQYNIVRQTEERPVGVDALVAVSGINNFRDEHAPTFGVLLSHKVGRKAAFYVEPIAVLNTHPAHFHVVPDEDDEDYTVLAGLGARLRIRPTVYLAVEAAPKLAGYRLGDVPYAFAIEKRVGGHAFQMVFANSIWTTYYDLAQFGGVGDDLYIGFNISRKFF